MKQFWTVGSIVAVGCAAVLSTGCAQRAPALAGASRANQAPSLGVIAEVGQPQQTLPPGWDRGPNGELIVPNAALMTHTGSIQMLFDRFDFVKSVRLDHHGRVVGFTLWQMGPAPAQLGTFEVRDVVVDRRGNIVSTTAWERREPPDCCTMTVTVTPTYTEFSCAGSCPADQTCVEKFEVIEDDTRFWCECVDAA